MIITWILYFIGLAMQSREEEWEWMLRLQQGDSEALRLIYRKYKRLVFGLILAIVKNREETEDCLQEVFTRLWENADQFDTTKGNLYSFLVTLARNKAIDRTRSRAYKKSSMEDHVINDFTLIPVSEGNNPHEDLEMSERASLLRRALTKLSTVEREVLYVAYFQGMSQTEISDQLNIPLGTVKYRMRQGMIKLKDLLLSGINQ